MAFMKTIGPTRATRRAGIARAAALAVGLAGGAAILGAWTQGARAQGAMVDPAKVEAGTYAVDPNHTQVGFGVSHMGFTMYWGMFSGASGTLELMPDKADSSKLSVSVPVASVEVPSEKLDGELKSADWLDAAKFPQMTFRSTSIKRTGKDTAQVTGELTLHGVTKPVVLEAHFMGAGTNPIDKKYTVGFEVSGKISRSEFGVKTYVPLIGDEVVLRISGAFEKQG